MCNLLYVARVLYTLISICGTSPSSTFLPENAHILMLGSFPPPKKRWSIDFFYPNMQNDMWRIFGLVFFDNKDYFVDTAHKRFNKPLLETFLREKGVALYDTACAVNRLQDNASDKFLEVVEHTDIDAVTPVATLPCHRDYRTKGYGHTTSALCGGGTQGGAIRRF